jgi:heterodisulfide reductase subunit A
MEEEPKVGVYVCHCGLNIAGTVNVKEVVEYARTLPNVVEADEYIFMCSSPGQELIKQGVKRGINRIVVAACSPSMHEPTFRAAMAEAGLNRYLLEMVNIREHSAWVHSDQKLKATEQTKDLIRMAVAKVVLLEPLEELHVAMQSTALVLGGGAAGLRASVDLAKRGYKVHIIEKRPTVGGRTVRLGNFANAETNGVSLLEPLMDAVTSDHNITLHANSEIVDVDGSIGYFKVKVRKNPRFIDARCTLCEECARVCPVEVPNEYEYGLSKRKAIYLPFKGARPGIFAIDPVACNKCGECVKVCKPGAINLNEEPKETDIVVGGLVIATGYQPYEPLVGEFGYKTSDRVLTLFQLERLLDPSGPTGGKLELRGQVPKTLAFIMCVGSLGTTENAHAYCSRMCCASAIKNMLRIKELHPAIELYAIYKDIRTYARKDERLYEQAAEHMVRFIKFEKPPTVAHSDPSSENISVKVYDPTLQENLAIPVDAVVLAVGMSPDEDLDKVRAVIKVGCSPEGFLREAHPKLRPVEAPADGIFLAGTVTSPKNVFESAMAGSASAAKMSSLLSKSEIQIEPIIAQVNEDICSGCSICIAMCPYGAISRKPLNAKRVAQVDTALCKACGACVAACPSGAMQQAGFKDVQLMAQIAAISERGAR